MAFDNFCGIAKVNSSVCRSQVLVVANWTAATFRDHLPWWKEIRAEKEQLCFGSEQQRGEEGKMNACQGAGSDADEMSGTHQPAGDKNTPSSHQGMLGYRGFCQPRGLNEICTEQICRSHRLHSIYCDIKPKYAYSHQCNVVLSQVQAWLNRTHCKPKPFLFPSTSWGS